MRNLSRAFIVLIAVPAGLGARQSPKPEVGVGGNPTIVQQPCPVPGIKVACATVWVSSRGELELNGKPGDLGRVDTAFLELAKRHGVVVYAREAARDVPHPVVLKVMDLIGKHELPVSMSTKRDFSDVLGPDGRPKPRTAG